MKCLCLILLASLLIMAEEKHSAQGIVLKVQGTHLFVSCEAIPGYMEAMPMQFTVRNAKVISGLKAGSLITFSITSQGKNMYAEDIHMGSTSSFESEPMAAAQLSMLNKLIDPGAAPLAIGDTVPDFTLVDQAGESISLAQLKGKVVLITFGYSRCPNPKYCYRLSSNLQKVEKRLHSMSGKELVLMTIMLDPEHDQGATLTQYAASFQANAADWHFLTGPLPEIKKICAPFGVNFWNVEGSLTHTLHTAIVDRQGRLAANLDGNHFTSQELRDLVERVIKD